MWSYGQTHREIHTESTKTEDWLEVAAGIGKNEIFHTVSVSHDILQQWVHHRLNKLINKLVDLINYYGVHRHVVCMLTP